MEWANENAADVMEASEFTALKVSDKAENIRQVTLPRIGDDSTCTTLFKHFGFRLITCATLYAMPNTT